MNSVRTAAWLGLFFAQASFGGAYCGHYSEARDQIACAQSEIHPPRLDPARWSEVEAHEADFTYGTSQTAEHGCIAHSFACRYNDHFTGAKMLRCMPTRENRDFELGRRLCDNPS